MIKKFFKFFLPFIFTIALLEISSKLIFGEGSGPKPTRNLSKIHRDSYYDEKELMKLPFTREVNGGNCVSINGFQDGINTGFVSFKWNQWWGFNQKELNQECVKKLFNSGDKSVVFMGGSSMENKEAPNYLTHLDYYATRKNPQIRSINLAESGARHKNMSIRFQREVIPLKPDIVLFLDGYNEFFSIRYGGKPENDVYWTRTGFSRMHRPGIIFLEKLSEKSSFANALLVRTGFLNSTRVAIQKVDQKDVILSAQYFLKDISVTNTLCKANKIKCLFVIQPMAFGSNASEHKEISKYKDSITSNHSQSYINGYKEILDNCDICINASKLFHGENGTFVDPVHFSKNGSVILGEFLGNLLM